MNTANLRTPRTSVVGVRQTKIYYIVKVIKMNDTKRDMEFMDDIYEILWIVGVKPDDISDKDYDDIHTRFVNTFEACRFCGEI